MAKWLDGLKCHLVLEVGLGQGNFVLDGNSAPHSPKRGQSPQFSAHVHCGQTAGRIKMAFGMEVGLSRGHIVLDGTQLPFPKRGQSPPPIFGPFVLWPNGWMRQDATWYGGRPRPMRHCVRWGRDPVLPPKRDTAPNFRPMSIVRGQTAVCIRMQGYMHLVRR